MESSLHCRSRGWKISNLGYLRKICSLWYNLTKKVIFLTLAGFGIFGPHKILGAPDDRQPAPSTYMTLMYNLHYTLSATHYHAPTGHWVVHGTDSLLPADYAPPPHNPGLDTYAT